MQFSKNHFGPILGVSHLVLKLNAVHLSRELDNKLRVAQSMSRSSMHEKTFSGTLGEDVKKYLMTHEKAFVDYKLSEAQVSH